MPLFRGALARRSALAGPIGGSAPTSDLEQDWINRRSAAGVTQYKKFDSASDVTNWLHPDGLEGHASFDTSDGIIGGGCLKINYPAELTNSSASWRIPLNTAWTADGQAFGSTPFYILYACKISPGKLVPSNGGGGFKFSIVGEYRVSSPGSSVSAVNNEVVVQNTNYRGALQAYRQDGSGFPGFDDYTTLPGEIMFQNAVDHGSGIADQYARYCLYQGGDASAGCWMIPEGEWFWVKQRIELPSLGGTTGNKFDLWAMKATDTAWSHLIHFENFLIGNGGGVTPNGPNGLWLLPYDTGRTSAGYDAWHKYDQIIVSTNDIAVPAAIPEVPYALPATGQVVVGATNRARDVKPAAFTASQFDESLSNSFGGGITNPYYSRYGASVWGPCGGHNHPDFTAQVVLNHSTGEWVLHEHNNGGVRYGGSAGSGLAYIAEQTNGAPWWEISDSPEVPSPPHPYQNNALLPPSLGGSARGSTILVGHTALGANGTNHSSKVHSYNPITNIWARIATNDFPGVDMTYDTAVIFDEKRSRYWVFAQGGNDNQYIIYLDATDWQFKTISIGDWPAVSAIGNGGCGWMYRDYLFLQTSAGTIACIDPDNVPGNWVNITISGAALPSYGVDFTYRNAFEYFPQTNKFYSVPFGGGTVIDRLTPPAGNPRTGTWVRDTYTLPTALSARTLEGSNDYTAYHRSLHYAEHINCMVWHPGGANYVQLFRPE